MHGGTLYDSNYFSRQQGSGIFAELLHQRFRVTSKRLGLIASVSALDTTQFEPPRLGGEQLELF
jgi:hypothetical protein